MSAYDSVVVGKLRLKGKPLDVKAGGIKKKKMKKTHDKSYHHLSESSSGSFFDYGSFDRIFICDCDQNWGFLVETCNNEDSINETDNNGGEGGGASYDDHLTPAERRYLKQTQKLELQRLAKMARSSHRDRIQEFNQYLANLSEHYDIPKVGPPKVGPG